MPMRVAEVVAFGGPEMLVPGKRPDPVAGPGEVVVDVAVASVTFVETQIRRGFHPWHAKPQLPYVPGGLVGGHAGTAGRVVARTDGTGGFAERAVVPAAALFPVPDGLGLPEAVTLHSDGSTAYGLIERVKIVPGDRVLVEAAAGGVGSLLVQLARAAGAQVIGAARGARKLALVRELGADVVVDYSREGWTRQVLEATDGTGPTVVFDGVGGPIGRAAYELTARDGRFSIHGASSGEPTRADSTRADPTRADRARRGIEVIGIDQLSGFAPEIPRRAARMMALAAEGSVRPVIGQTFPLDQAAAAHAAVESRATLGKTLIVMS